jgi:hypothetical protein
MIGFPSGRVLVAASLLVAGLLADDTASAELWRMHGLPSGQCQKAAIEGGTVQWDWEGVRNSDTASQLYMDCSLPILNTKSNPPGSPVYGEVVQFVMDNSNVDDVVCNMKVVDGITITFTGAQKQTNGTPGSWWVAWEDVPASLGVPYTACRIPAATNQFYSGLDGLYAGFNNQ